VNVDGAQVLHDAGARQPLPARSLVAFGPGAGAVEVAETTRFLRIDPDAVYDLAVERVDLVPALLDARQHRFAGAGA
jgi:hypothetical protein